MAARAGVSPRRDHRVKRAMDVLLATVALAALAPVAAVIAAAILVTMGPPVLFRQQRLGYRGRPFAILKFRTMRPTRDATGALLPDAHRLTPVGRILRALTLDELPEFINVFRGEMSLVGPRPLLPEYWDRYSPEQRRRHEAMPGLTGWAVVNGRNALTWEAKFALDLWYVEHQSFWLDVRILAMTGWMILSRQGISQPGHVTAERFQGVPASGEDGKSARGAGPSHPGGVS